MQGWRTGDQSGPAEPPGKLLTASPPPQKMRLISVSPLYHSGWRSPAQAVCTDLELKPYQTARMRSFDQLGVLRQAP